MITPKHAIIRPTWADVPTRAKIRAAATGYMLWLGAALAVVTMFAVLAAV